MTEQQTTKIKCPHCGWVRSLQVAATADLATTHVVRGASDALKAVAERIRDMLADHELDQANAWIDLPECPHCGNPYRYNVTTGETQR
jgi:uncharacterized protein (UPF0212 family)